MPTASLIINVIIAILTVVAWIQLMIPSEANKETLAATGLRSLQYFTVLSNLFSAIVSVVYLVCAPAAAGPLPHWLLALKLSSGAAVMVTFTTVLVFLGPTKGFTYMYVSGNLWLHLVLPLLAAIDCVLFVPVGSLPFAHTAWAMAPTVLYGIFYLTRCGMHGLLSKSHGDHDAETYDFYGFLSWGRKGVLVVAPIMLAASWGLGCMLYFLSQALCH